MASYTTEIAQSLPFIEVPVGQELIVGLSCDACVTQEQNVKFCFNIYVGDNSITAASIGIFKTTPNNAGVGLLDVNRILENYVSADNIATDNSRFKINGGIIQDIPIHLIDAYSRSKNAVRYFVIVGYTEFTDSVGDIVNTANVTVASGRINNGYVKHSDTIKFVEQGWMGAAFSFGYSLEDYGIVKDETKKFLTNAPSTQYVRAEDYGTLSFLALSSFSSNLCDVDKYEVKLYKADDTVLTAYNVLRTTQTGAMTGIYYVTN